MDRKSIYYLDEGDCNTFDFDENLPPLPLPELSDTLKRYYETVQPFGTEAELAITRAAIEKFENGVGKKLHAKLKERAGRLKNWLDEWWDKYAYHMLRLPLNPYIVMAMPANLSILGIEESSENLLKNLARIMYHTVEFWDLLRRAKIKPLSSNGGKTKYSSALYKRFFSTTRVPGVEFDHIENHFKEVYQGKTPSHALISGKGRIFTFETVHDDGTIITTMEIYILLQRIRSILDCAPVGDCVPVLTHDNRTEWAHNRQRLLEISPHNQQTIKLIESSSMVIAFDENEPKDYEEASQIVINGDYHSKWGDRSSTLVAYKNGKFAYIGEHSAYDGTVSVSFAIYILLSLSEVPEPDWENIGSAKILQFNELKFDLHEKLNDEIKRVLEECNERRTDVLVTYDEFNEYGKKFLKEFKLHPDSYVQVIMQLAYYTLHGSIAPTYETALMRHFYNGRTETLRSCTSEVYTFLKIATDPNATKFQIVNALKTAVQHHNHMMNEARMGHGVDRHLFGLWCIAYEDGMDIPDFFSDPLYMKSGGGGNFVLSTSTLGYSSAVGFVAPMILDGYGFFYSITDETLYIQITAFRNSIQTSAHKFYTSFVENLRRIKALLEDVHVSKI